jgi:hypothetical protein
MVTKYKTFLATYFVLIIKHILQFKSLGSDSIPTCHGSGPLLFTYPHNASIYVLLSSQFDDSPTLFLLQELF